MSADQHNVQPDDTASDLDRRFLNAAIELGYNCIGRTAPNPSVGAIIVRYDSDRPKVVGRGVTGDGGRPHGEVAALNEAGKLAQGATCYVSLEPCAHHGKTPPCVEALLHAGIARVVIATEDPDPRVKGRGTAYLRENGITVFENVESAKALRANLGHIKRVQLGRPAVTLKLAVSKDGKIGRKGEGFIRITNDLSRKSVHAMRARSDTVLVGIGTILADDPDLTCRLPGLESWSKPRLILDTKAQTPLDAKLFDKIDDVPVHIVVGAEADESKVIALEERGAGLIRMENIGKELVLESLLMRLAEEGMTNLFVEGGQQVASAFLDAGFVDRVHLFHGQEELGDAESIYPLTENRDISQALPAAGFEIVETANYDGDLLETWERS